jgi:2-methylcitrate dehydratase PrpD
MAGLTAQFAAFAASSRYEDLPPQAPALLTDAITDAIGCGLAGSREPLADMLLHIIGTSAAPDSHFLFGCARRASAVEAALYNGAVIHAVDYDDSSHPSYGHPSSHLVPALLTLGRQRRRDGHDLLLAYAVGLELEGKLGRALNIGHYMKGWHPTASMGALGAAATAAKLLGLDAARVASAIAIATSAAAGARANFGTMTKPLHAGYAARAGVLAALLAEQGCTAAPDVLENPHGYLALYAGTDAVDSSACAQWGEPWEIATDYGIAIKPYPSCGSTHTAIEGALRARQDLQGETVAAVRVGTNEMCSQTLVYSDPQTPLQGKYCMEYCIAAALVLGAVNLRTFSTTTLQDPRIRALMPKITVEVDERMRHSREHGTVVTVLTAEGLRIEHVVPLARGKPERWLGREERWAKFLDCASAALDEAQARVAFDTLQRLPALTGTGAVDELLAPLAPGAAATVPPAPGAAPGATTTAP